MNNNIEEDYCSFEVSKLLKEKGFNIDWRIFNGNSFGYYPNHGDGAGWYEGACEASTDIIQSPTHSLAIKWIRENFGIHIIAEAISSSKWMWKSVRLKDNSSDGGYPFNSPEEAVDAALLYTLKNLI